MFLFWVRRKTVFLTESMSILSIAANWWTNLFKSMYIVSAETTLSYLFWLPSERRSALKGTNLLPPVSKFFSLRVDLFSEGDWCAGKQIGTHKNGLPCEKSNVDPLKLHCYIVKLGFTGVYIIFLISVQKHRLWVLVRIASSRRF